MLKNFQKYARIIFLSLTIVFLISCQAGVGVGPSEITDQPSIPNQTEMGNLATPDRAIINKLKITFKINIVDFGWMPDGKIYYGVGGDPRVDSAESVTDIDETAWYAYNIKGQETARVIKPYARLSTDLVQSLEHGQTVNILYMTISPSMDKVIYTRLPDNYERPKPLPHDYVDPAEIWITENLPGFQEEGTTYPLSNNSGQLYDCGSALGAESRWFSEDTLVLGSCYFTYGIVRVYFLADLLSRKIQFLDFESEAGEYAPSEEIAIAHDSPSLAFQTDEGFWLVPVSKSERQIPLKLTELNFLFDDRPAIAPTWSVDDQWIYYWTVSQPTKYDENGFVEYQPWWLEKMNVTTKEREVVLSEKQLLSLLGYDMYRRNTPQGVGNPWKLSPDEKSVLLFLSETVDTPAELLLISW